MRQWCQALWSVCVFVYVCEGGRGVKECEWMTLTFSIVYSTCVLVQGVSVHLLMYFCPVLSLEC